MDRLSQAMKKVFKIFLLMIPKPKKESRRMLVVFFNFYHDEIVVLKNIIFNFQ